MAAKGRIVNTTPKGKHSIERTRFTVIHSGGTYSRGRNEERRLACADVKRVRAVLVKHHASLLTLGRAPKRPNDSSLRMNMVANRRLRQMDGRRYG